MSAGVLYGWLIHPLVEEKSEIEDSLEYERELLEAVCKQQKNSENIDVKEQSQQLQSQLPVTPYHEQLFSMINKAEEATNSTVNRYDISNRESVSIEDIKGLKGVLYDLEVTSPSYKSMIGFIEHLQNQERILSVNYLSFTTEGGEGITYQLSLSAFFKDDLDGLQAYQPTMNIPDPDNQKNPLS